MLRVVLGNEGGHLDSNVKINVVTRRVRRNPDGTRTVLGEERSVEFHPRRRGQRRAMRWIAGLSLGVGAMQATYGIWTGRSDKAAASVFHAARDCQSSQLLANGSTSTSDGVCALEPAMVVRTKYYSTRGGRTYWVRTVTPAGKTDDTPLAGRNLVPFWRRLRPTQRVMIQRFIAPGYHLTGAITAVADETSAQMTRANPDAGAQRQFVNVVMGAMFAVLGLALLARGAPD